MDNIFILDRDKIKRDILSNHGSDPPNPFYNDKRKIYLNTGAETLEFDTHGMACFNGYLLLGNYAMFKENGKYYLYQIMSVDTEHGDDMVKNCYCETVGLELRNHAVRSMTIDGDVRNFFNTILLNSPFKLGYVEDGINEVKSVKVEKPVGAYQLIQDNLSTFNIEIEFAVEYKNNRVVGQVINVYRQRGKVTNIRFEYGKNVDKVKKSEDLSEFCTALIGIGSGGCDFKNNEWSIANGNPVNKPLNQDFIADMEAFNFKNNNDSHIMGIFEGQSTNGADLLLETWNELQRVKSPKIDYEFNVALLNVNEVGIGDTVYCIDNDYNPPLHLSARISELELSSTDPSKNKCTLSNYKEVKSKIKMLNKEDIMQDVLDYINSLTPGILTEVQINNLKTYLTQLSLTKEEVDYIFETIIGNSKLDIIEGENLELVLQNGKIYACQTLKSLKIKFPTEPPSGYKSQITFRTPVDTEPMIFNQSNHVWLKGTDCINGALLPRPDTEYQINIVNGSSNDEKRRYGGTVTAKHFGGEYKPFTNYKGGEKVVEIGATWYAVRDNFTYKTKTPLSPFAKPNTHPAHPDNIGKWKNPETGIMNIDCSTFTNHLFKCRKYEESIYANLENGIGVNTKHSYATDLGRLAADQAKICVTNGWMLHDIKSESDWNKLKPGDLVFWSSRTEDEGRNEIVADRFMQVGHVAVIRGFNDNGDVHTYEVTNLSHTIRNRLLKDNYPEKILFFARVRKG